MTVGHRPQLTARPRAGSFSFMSRPASTLTGEPREGALRFGPLNWALLAAALAAIAIGFVTLAGGSTVAAPLLLVLGYVILLPLGIIL
jgi:hypothetical protein